MEKERREAAREAATGDERAAKQVRVARCRAGECCAHAVGPTLEMTGCEGCLFLGWHYGDERWICNLSDAADVPINEDMETIAAVPAQCPLWQSPVTVDLRHLRQLRRGN